jgi:diguanylate cyclase (GGDEF)-like protein
MVVFLCSTLLGVALAGHEPANAATDVRRWSRLADAVFVHVARDTELPNGAVPSSLADDAAGFLWVGSQNGLARWDGYHFHAYRADPKTPGALPDGAVKLLFTDAAGRLWVGMKSGGLARYDPDDDRFVSYPARPGRSAVSDIPNAMSDDGSGGIWLGTDGGLIHLDPASGKFSRARPNSADPHGQLSGSVRALVRDRRGVLWVGTSGGLTRRVGLGAPVERIDLPVPRGMGAAGVWSLAEDSAGRIWAGTTGNGAYVVAPGAQRGRPVHETDRPASALQTQWVHSLIEARPGEMWLGTFGQGIVAIDTATLRSRRIGHDPTLPTSLPDDTVWVLHRDQSGLVWVGTDRSLSHCDPGGKGVLTLLGGSSRSDGISDASVTAVLPAADGRIWLGLAENGVDILDPDGVRTGELRPVPQQPSTSLPKVVVNSIALGAHGDMYLGTDGGLFRADRSGRRVTPVNLPGRDQAAAVVAVLFDSGTFWIGGPDGLRAMTAAARPERALPMAGLTDRRITALVRGPGSDLWVGTENGLNRIDLRTRRVEQIRTFSGDQAAPDAGYISSLLIDRSGRLWVGTSGGIEVLEGRQAGGRPDFRRLDTAQGLPNSNVSKLLADPGGDVWASTDDGLAVIDQRSLAIRALHQADGVAIARYWSNSGAVTARGELLFGGLGGLTVVRRARLANWAYRPQIVVTDVRVGGKPVPAGRFNGAGSNIPLAVSPGANSLAVEFSALDFSAPERNRYAYMLDGYDTGWTETDATRRLAAYTNLPPGDYVLRLRGSNHSGALMKTARAVPIRVLPAWNQTVWFRLAQGCAALAIVATLILLRTTYLERRAQRLEKLVAARTAELLQSQQRLEQLAYSDLLTSLPNRRMFTEDFHKRLALTRRQGGYFALLLIDLDHFKQVNDTLGHDAGDALLLEVANRLRSVVRESDCVARLGGDEFAILLAPDDDTAGIDSVCRRLLDCFDAPVLLGGTEMQTTVSVGVALFPDHGETQDVLYKAADLALYAAKRTGRNTWCRYRPELHAPRAAGVGPAPN